jgi:CheY-like chemotaxis protein
MRENMDGSIPMSHNHAMKPRLLLVEDDPISSRFLVTVLQALPAEVDTATGCSEALALDRRYALWLIDANLPDGSGSDLLVRPHRRRVRLVAPAAAGRWLCPRAGQTADRAVAANRRPRRIGRHWVRVGHDR